MSDFRSVIERDLYYVDKSMYLAELEKKSDTLIFIRPRRFGKSLFINMMRLYYDKAAAGGFDRLFGHLWIGQHPTPLRGRYQVLYMDFSQIGGNISRLEENFSEYCSLSLDDFMRKYRSEYPDDVVSAFFATDTYSGKLKLIVDNANKLQIPLYLIIDEYDNFTNVVLNEQGEEMYHAITHADGFYRDLFKKFKGNFERIFPAVDVTLSSTRRDDLLYNPAFINRIWILRNHLADMTSVEAMEFLKTRMERTESNEEFLITMNGDKLQ